MRRGVTLIELIVVLAILAVIAGVTTLAFLRADVDQSVPAWANALAAARRTALDSARNVTLTITIGDTVLAATALSDGSMIADSRFGRDRLSGEPIHAP